MNDSVDIEKIIERLKIRTGLTQSKEVASLFGLSPTDFGNRKKRGTLLPLLIDWAMNEKVDLQYFIVGEEDSESLPMQEEPVNVPELRDMTTVVLESNTIYRAALAANIRAFYRSVKNEEEKLEMNDHLKRIEAKHDADMQELKQMIQALSTTQPEKKSLAA